VSIQIISAFILPKWSKRELPFFIKQQLICFSRRQQRVKGEQDGVMQSPPQVLEAPTRKRRGASAKPLSSAQKQSKPLESQPLSQPSQQISKPKPSQARKVKKSRLRNLQAAKDRQEQAQATKENTPPRGDSSAEENEPYINGKKDSNSHQETLSPKLNFINGPLLPINQETAQKPLSPLRPTISSQKSGLGSTSETLQVSVPKRATTRNQRALREHAANIQKAFSDTPSTPRAGNKRKAQELSADSEEEEEHDGKRIEKTWSFKPDDTGALRLIGRDEIDPNDNSVVYLNETLASPLIKKDFDRIKRVQFANAHLSIIDDMTEEQKQNVLQRRAEMEEEMNSVQSLKRVNEIFANYNARTSEEEFLKLAYKFDRENESLLHSVTNGEGPNWRDDLAKSLRALADSLDRAGSYKNISPEHRQQIIEDLEKYQGSDVDTDQPITKSLTNNASSQHSQSEALADTTAKQSIISTPRRIVKAVRGALGYLSFGRSSRIPEPTQSSITEQSIVRFSPKQSSETDGNGDEQLFIQNASTLALEKYRVEPHGPSHFYADDEVSKLPELPSQGAFLPNFTARENQNHRERRAKELEPSGNTVTKPTDDMEKFIDAEVNRRLNERIAAYELANQNLSRKRKFGSKQLPLTPAGKIPGPASGGFGLNQDYFYNSDSDSESSEEEEKTEEPLPKRRRAAIQDIIDQTAAANAKAKAAKAANNFKTGNLSVPAPRGFTAPYDDSSSSDEEPQISSVDRQRAERERAQAERLRKAVQRHQPKTPSRLREYKQVPQSPISVRMILNKRWRNRGTKRVLASFVRL
jgi:hypothetical protein